MCLATLFVGVHVRAGRLGFSWRSSALLGARRATWQHLAEPVHSSNEDIPGM